MFAHPIWSLLLLAAPIAIFWFVIRPRLKAKFTDLYAHIDSFWGRVWARTYAFRSFWIAAFGAVIAALPDLLVKVSTLDFSGLPQPWGGWVAFGVAVIIPLMKALETKPKDEQA